MDNFDTKLLRVFDEINRTRSVSLAAERMGMSQSTMSFCLAKLRALFGDPLFVRTAEGMVPTARAQEVAERVAAAQASLQALLQPVAFEPARSDRLFRLCMTDISHIVLLPRIVNRLRDSAPAVRIDIQRIASDTPSQLESGQADMSIGFMPQIDAGFYRQRLFEQDFVCIAGAAHPRIRHHLDLDAFRREGHVDVSASMSSQQVVERTLKRLGVERNIVLRLPNYLGLATVIAQTDLVATVPRLLADSFARQESLRVFEPPFAIARYAVNQYWHARHHQDPGHAWLRQLLAELFLDRGERPVARKAATARKTKTPRGD